MKKNKVAILLVIILGSISFWFIINKGDSTIKATLRDFAVKDTASINKIFLADKNGNAVTLERKDSGNWTVNDQYNIRPDALQTLLTTIQRIDVKEPIGKNAQNNVIKRLAAKAIKCEIYQNNKLTKAYYVGTETPDLKGTYMILIDLETMKPSEKAFITYIPGFEGYLTTRYFVEERGWRDRTVFQYVPNEIKSVKVEAPSKPEFNYELSVMGNNDYHIKMLSKNQLLKNLDTLAVKQYLSYFQQLNFESFEVELKPTQIDSVLRSQPTNILTVTDNKGKINKVMFFARNNLKGLLDYDKKPLPFDLERMDALLNNGKDFVMVQFFVFGKVLPTPDYFQKEMNPVTPLSGKPKNIPKV